MKNNNKNSIINLINIIESNCKNWPNNNKNREIIEII